MYRRSYLGSGRHLKENWSDSGGVPEGRSGLLFGREKARETTGDTVSERKEPRRDPLGFSFTPGMGSTVVLRKRERPISVRIALNIEFPILGSSQTVFEAFSDTLVRSRKYLYETSPSKPDCRRDDSKDFWRYLSLVSYFGLFSTKSILRPQGL